MKTYFVEQSRVERLESSQSARMPLIIKSYYFILLLCFYSCTEKKTQTIDGWKNVALKSHRIEVSVPDSFEEMTVDEYSKTLRERVTSEDLLTQLILGSLENVQINKSNFKIFVNSENLEESVWFQKGSYISFNQYSAKTYLTSVEQQFEQIWKEAKVDFGRLESKFSEGKKLQKFELKYELHYNGKFFYLTQFFITANGKTISVITRGSESGRYDGIIEKIRM
jgi:hypothetical protein